MLFTTQSSKLSISSRPMESSTCSFLARPSRLASSAGTSCTRPTLVTHVSSSSVLTIRRSRPAALHKVYPPLVAYVSPPGKRRTITNLIARKRRRASLPEAARLLKLRTGEVASADRNASGSRTSTRPASLCPVVLVIRSPIQLVVHASPTSITRYSHRKTRLCSWQVTVSGSSYQTSRSPTWCSHTTRKMHRRRQRMHLYPRPSLNGRNIASQLMISPLS